MLGALLLLWVWLLWPEPDHEAVGGSQLPLVTAAIQSPGRLAAIPASIAISAKRQLSGEVVAGRDRIERRLPHAAKAMPEPSVLGGAATRDVAGVAEDAGAEPEISAGAETAPSVDAEPSVLGGAATRDVAGVAEGAGAEPEISAAAETAPSVDAEPSVLGGAATRDVAGVAEDAGAEPEISAATEKVPSADPEPSVLGGAAARDVAGVAEGAGAEPEISAPETAPSAVAEPSLTIAALGPGPEAALVGRMEAVIESAAAPAAGSADDGSSSAVLAPLDAPAAVVLPPQDADQPTPAWLRNAVASAADGRPAIALVIDDMGYNRRAAAAINRLRAPLTLAFLPYATKLDEQTRAARAAGHELLVHVPMEPRGREWPGPNALTSQLEPAELISRLRMQLSSFRGFVGINNHMGSLLTTDPMRMAVLMTELRRLGLLFLDSRTTPQSIAGREAERMGVPHAQRDVFIDNDLDRGSVLRALESAERIARHHGHAVVIGHPHDVTIEALKTWLPTLEARDIALVPISAIVARRSCAGGILLVADACARHAVAATAAE